MQARASLRLPELKFTLGGSVQPATERVSVLVTKAASGVLSKTLKMV